MGDMREGMENLSKSLLSLHVKDVFTKNDDGLKLRNLSEKDKEQMRQLFKNLEEQVNEFVAKTKEGKDSAEADKVEKEKRKRTTLRDRVRKNKG